jgi:hypothetical protein
MKKKGIPIKKIPVKGIPLGRKTNPSTGMKDMLKNKRGTNILGRKKK